MRARPVEFPIPQGFTPPEGVTPGEDFDVVSTFRVRPNGTVCLVQLGDAKMPGYDAKPDQRPSYSDYAKGIAAEMNGG